MSLRDQIAEAQDASSEIVDLPEWGIKVEVRGMRAAERATMLKAVVDEDGNTDLEKLYPLLVTSTTYDPSDNTKVFEDSDAPMLMSKAAAPVERIATVAMRLSGLSKEATAKLGKGSQPIQNDVSTSN